MTPTSPVAPLRCSVCHNERPPDLLVPASTVREPLLGLITKETGTWDPAGTICNPCLHTWRTRLVLKQLEEERGSLSEIEQEIARKASAHVAIASNIDAEFAKNATFGARAADTVARVGGSWTFLFVMSGLLACWITWNTLKGSSAPDPYPFILLNLGLSCLAAFQAPIIMMAQNRQSKRDRAEADQDYRVNLKAEIEIGNLHEKVDHLLHVQWEHLVALQELQIEMLQDLVKLQHAPAEVEDAPTQLLEAPPTAPAPPATGSGAEPG